MLNRSVVTDETQVEIRTAYEKIFHEMLPEVVAENDPSTSYWPSSPWRREGTHGHEAGELSGDSHFWDVWHSRKPIKSYELWKFRFVSEFGMQSYSSPATNATFCPKDDSNVFGPTMENHQKNAAGNQIILDYVSRQYRFPKSQDDLIYLSQLNQARCMQMGVEHYRRLMPRCMGSLYWQLNDCWPVASWSSIEFTGRWKALHYAARRFYAPALVSAHVPGDEVVTIGNYRKSTMDEAHLYTVYDAPKPAKGVLAWDLMHIDGHRIGGGSKRVALRPGESVKQKSLDLHKVFKKTSHDDVYLRIGLEIGGERVSEETVFLASPRFLHLPRGKITCKVKMTGDRAAELTFSCPVLQHRFAFDIAGTDFRASNNFFELYPNEPKTVKVTLKRKTDAAKLRKALSWRSLVDTY
jgi:beta-mannosidase